MTYKFKEAEQEVYLIIVLSYIASTYTYVIVGDYSKLICTYIYIQLPFLISTIVAQYRAY